MKNYYLPYTMLILLSTALISCTDDDLNKDIIVRIETKNPGYIKAGGAVLFGKITVSQPTTVLNFGFLVSKKEGTDSSSATTISFPGMWAVYDSLNIRSGIRLEPKTKYFVKAFVTLESGTSIYGSEIPFTSTDGDDWLMLPYPPFEDYSTGFSIENNLYVVNAFNDTINKPCWHYDINSGVWTKKSDFPKKCIPLSPAFSIGSKGYVVLKESKECWEYDPAIDSWTKKLNFPGPDRYNGISFTIDGKGYIGAGWNGDILNDFWQFDPNDASKGLDEKNNPLGNWVIKADLDLGIYHGASFVLANKGYVLSDRDDGIKGSYLFEYNPVEDKWTTKAPYLGEEAEINNDFLCFSIGLKGYTGAKEEFWEYKPLTNEWVKLQNKPIMLDGVACSFNGRAYVLARSFLYEYIPKN